MQRKPSVSPDLAHRSIRKGNAQQTLGKMFHTTYVANGEASDWMFLKRGKHRLDRGRRGVLILVSLCLRHRVDESRDR